MENLTKQTLRDAKARQALGLELNTFEENKDVPIAGTSYALTYRGHDWIIDGEFALNCKKRPKSDTNAGSVRTAVSV